ncbi:hypothetical protein, variant 3 [Aphanomyces astaci]|uniref:PWI domain-containing protein n=1 Tax=Aphanomyces astaci TaxID=112090 RepID=W4FMM5_APHAT|nr:hypothetical protein, variant 3 [Aphanomyces astaci]ETV68730.1 hypothetical protein, variant 3 [Aphanomyces astaci]|eukprot:XP_009841684.1 hypothetical protein, variant 3 [Aphanomyces astaci]
MTIPELEAIDSALEARLAANHRMQSELEEMETRILEFLKETDIALFPAVEDVSCNCIPEHFVPPAALPQHLKRCHGIVTHEGEPSSTQFFYQQPPSVNTARQTTQVPPPTESIPFEPVADPNDHFVDVSFDDDAAGVTDMSTLDDDVAPSLVEPSKSDTNTVVSFKDAVLAIASTPHDLHAHCSSWTSIPAVFSRPDTSTLAASSPIIHTWATSWCYSKANSPNDSATQALVAYIVQLVEHPDYCHPDIMAGELGEFLGASTSRFVLELWAVLTVVLAIDQVCFLPTTTPASFVRELASIQQTRRLALPSLAHASLNTAAPQHGALRTPATAAGNPEKKRKLPSYPRKAGSKRTSPIQVRPL